jgi:seryl-tRNA synthetase
MFIPTRTLPVVADRDGSAVLGRTRHALMGIRYVEGDGGGDTTTTTTDATGTGDTAPWTKDNFDPERAYRLVENLRGDLTAARTKTDQQIAAAAEQAKKDTLAEFAKLLGGGGEQQETDPVKLAAKVTDLSSQVQAKDGDLTQAQADLKARDLTIAVLSNPAVRAANTELLLNNEQFKTSIASVEPTDGAAITAAITKALQANAALKATPSRSGGGEHQGATVESLETQLAAATKNRDFTESIRLKQLISAAKQRAAGA